MAQRTLTVEAEQSLYSSGNRGNSNDDHMPIGLWSGSIFRELLKIKFNWASVYRIQTSYLVLDRTSQVHVGRGGSPKVTLRSLDAKFKTGGGSEGSWTTSGDGTVYPGPAVTGTAHDSNNLGTSNTGTDRIDITWYLNAMAPSTVLKSDGNPGDGGENNGFRIISFDEGSGSRTTEWYSIRGPSGHKPYIEFNFDDNHPPAIPIIVSPVGTDTPELIGTTSGVTDVTEYDYFDQDGDPIHAVQVQYFVPGATDESHGTALIDASEVGATPTSQLGRYSISLSVLLPRTEYRKRIRVQDSNMSWSEWSSLADGYIKSAYKPRKPGAPAMSTTPDNPHIYGTLSSDDPSDFLSGWGGIVQRSDSSGTVVLYPVGGGEGYEGIGGGTRSDVATGLSLQDGDHIQYRHWHFNRDGIRGDESEWYDVTIATPVGPTELVPTDTATKQLSRTPAFKIRDASTFATMRVKVYRYGVLVHDSGTVAASPSIVTGLYEQSYTIPSGVLSWGDGGSNEMTWVASVRSEIDSPPHTFRINALPTTTLTASA